jgi:hypothetical protein
MTVEEMAEYSHEGFSFFYTVVDFSIFVELRGD